MNWDYLDMTVGCSDGRKYEDLEHRLGEGLSKHGTNLSPNLGCWIIDRLMESQSYYFIDIYVQARYLSSRNMSAQTLSSTFPTHKDPNRKKRLCIRSQYCQAKSQQPIMIHSFSSTDRYLPLVNVSWYLRSIPIAPCSHMNNRTENQPGTVKE